jgi:short subunit dehydrogenase-like uncharacterized protein
MIYGANGYTGSLIAQEAARRGMRPVLAGRRENAIAAQARELALPARAFSLRSPAAVAEQLRDVQLVLNCAGPFSKTATTMVEACLLARANYLDITGEIDVIEWAASQDEKARRSGIAVIPAVGFDVVPSDCLASILKDRLPSATHLQLAFWSSDSLSRGTARTVWSQANRGGRIRQDGKIISVPHAWKQTTIPFHDRSRRAVTLPWGDVATAYYTTGIPNIEVYGALPPASIAWMRRLRRLSWLSGMQPVRGLMDWLIRRSVVGPDDEKRARSRAEFWGCVADADGNKSEARLTTPGGYALTIQTALAAVERMLGGGAVPTGFSTPARFFGADLVLELPQVRLH